MNGAGIGRFFNVLNFGQMYGLHVMLLPIGVTFLVVVHIVMVRTRRRETDRRRRRCPVREELRP